MRICIGIIFTFLFVLCCNLSAQKTKIEYKYWVKFSDKNNSEFSVFNPSEFLSQRAIDRRERYNIPVEEEDLPVNSNYINDLKNWKEGIKILHSSKWFNAVAIQFEDTTKTFLAGIDELTFVSDTVLLSQVIVEGSDDRPFYNDKFEDEAEENEMGGEFKDYWEQLDFMNGLGLHENEFKGQGMLIAVIDNGFPHVDTLRAYQSLFEDNRLLAHKDFVELDNDVFNNNSSHGTKIVSTCAANLPGEFVGTAPLADYIFLISEAPGEHRIEEVNWVVAAEFADSCGADVTNTSLGYSDFDGTAYDYTPEEMDGQTTIIAKASNVAASKGMLVITSAGNEGNSDWGIITSPGDAPGAFTIGGVQPDSSMYTSSSQGPTADSRIKPDVVAPGFNVIYLNNVGTVRDGGNGTSYAAPILAGLATCLWQSNLDKTPEEIKQAIIESAHLASMPNYEMGNGIPDFALAYKIINGSDLPAGIFNISDKSDYPSQLNNDKLKYYTDKTGKIKVELLSNNGRLLAQQSFFALENQYNVFHLNFNNLVTKGLYILSIEDNFGRKESLKFIR